MSIIKRKTTNKIYIADIPIGGDSLIAVQSMTNTDTEDIDASIKQIEELESAGCEIIRVAIPGKSSIKAFSEIKSNVKIPIIADIHFDHNLAISAADAGADGLRINPGNIGSINKVKLIVDAAKANSIPIRVGVNSGSLEKDIFKKYNGITPEAMVESALRHIQNIESMNFYNMKVSIKSSNVLKTIEAYRLLSSKTNYPLHVGVTEAGTLYSGTVKSSIGIGVLLSEGIGDTIRVSLTRDPVEEIKVAYEILKALGLRQRGPEIVSCPKCGRCKINLYEIVDQVEKALINFEDPIKIAIMGCIVNGPGEAKEADIGIAGGDGKGILFKKGKLVKKFPQDKLVNVLLNELL